VRQLFASARFPQYQSSTSDDKDIHAWTTAFRHRVDQIADARCQPEAFSLHTAQP
jgi:hypothetical protein